MRALTSVANRLEGDLLALEATATTAAVEATATATTAATVTEATAAATTATTVTEATTATTTTTATATTEAAAATAATETTAAAATVVVTSLGIVKADLATLNGLAVQLIESLLGIINGAECDVSETLGATRLTTAWLA